MRAFYLIFCLFLVHIGLAQRPDSQADHWFFGSSIGIQFKGGNTPQLISGNNLSTERSSAVYTDRNGVLKLYSNGQSVWNQNGNIIAGAERLINSFDPEYPGLIIPIPESETDFYVLSVDDTFGSPDPNNVTFPIFITRISLAGNNGEGEVTEKSFPLMTDTSFGMTTVKHCNNIDYWLVIHRGVGNGFLVYLIDKDGIHRESMTEYEIGTPFKGSSLGLQQSILSSSDGSLLALTKPLNPEGGFFETFNFDNATGEIKSRITTVKNLGNIAGAALSPNGKFIYLSRQVAQESIDANSYRNVYQLEQYRTSVAPQYQEILTRQKFTGRKGDNPTDNFLVDPGTFGNLKLAPNNKIYMAHIDDAFLSVIEKPNEPGSAASLNYYGFDLNGRKTKGQFPATISPDYPEKEALLVFSGDSLSCNPTLKVFTRGLNEKQLKFEWYKNDTLLSGQSAASLRANDAGQYEVLVADSCNSTLSNFKYVLNSSSLNPPIADSTITLCAGQKLEPLTIKKKGIKWYNDISTTNLLTESEVFSPPLNENVVQKKAFYVTQSDSNCESAPAEIIYEILENKPIDLSESVLKACFDGGQKITISPSTFPESPVQWKKGEAIFSNEPTIEIGDYGQYILMKTDLRCPSSDTIHVEDGCFRLFIPNSFSPNSDGHNDVYRIFGNGKFNIDFEVTDRNNQIVCELRNVDFDDRELSLWDGNINGANAPSGVYHFQMMIRSKEENNNRTELKTGTITLIR